MLSRIAESFYWIGRYVERMDNTICLLDVMSLSARHGKAEAENDWEPLILVSQGREFFDQFYDQINEQNTHDFLVFSLNNPGSVFSCLKAIRDNLRSVRNRVPNALWLVVNEFYLSFKRKKPHQVLSYNRGPFYRQIREFCVSFHGTADGTLMHEEAWSFLHLGKSLERAIETANILDLKCHLLTRTTSHDTIDRRQWHELLQSVDALEAYYNTYLNRIEPEKAIELLFLHRHFPRSVRFCLQEIDHALRSLPTSMNASYHWLLKIKIRGLLSEFLTITSNDIIKKGLHEYLQTVLKQLLMVNDLLYKTFFGFAGSLDILLPEPQPEVLHSLSAKRIDHVYSSSPQS